MAAASGTTTTGAPDGPTAARFFQVPEDIHAKFLRIVNTTRGCANVCVPYGFCVFSNAAPHCTVQLSVTVQLPEDRKWPEDAAAGVSTSMSVFRSEVLGTCRVNTVHDGIVELVCSFNLPRTTFPDFGGVQMVQVRGQPLVGARVTRAAVVYGTDAAPLMTGKKEKPGSSMKPALYALADAVNSEVSRLSAWKANVSVGVENWHLATSKEGDLAPQRLVGAQAMTGHEIWNELHSPNTKRFPTTQTELHQDMTPTTVLVQFGDGRVAACTQMTLALDVYTDIRYTLSLPGRLTDPALRPILYMSARELLFARCEDLVSAYDPSCDCTTFRGTFSHLVDNYQPFPSFLVKQMRGAAAHVELRLYLDVTPLQPSQVPAEVVQQACDYKGVVFSQNIKSRLVQNLVRVTRCVGFAPTPGSDPLAGQKPVRMLAWPVPSIDEALKTAYYLDFSAALGIKVLVDDR